MSGSDRFALLTRPLDAASGTDPTAGTPQLLRPTDARVNMDGQRKIMYSDSLVGKRNRSGGFRPLPDGRGSVWIIAANSDLRHQEATQGLKTLTGDPGTPHFRGANEGQVSVVQRPHRWYEADGFARASKSPLGVTASLDVLLNVHTA